MDVSALCTRMGLRDSTVIRKSQELHRLYAIKSSQRSTNTTQNVALIDLACRSLNVNQPDIAILHKYAGCTKPAAYAVTLGAVSQVLGMTVHLISIRQLCVQHGCMHIAQQCEAAFSRYQQLHTAREKPAYERPVYTVAMFCLIAKKMKCTVDRIKLRDQYGIKEVEFKAITQSMIDTCPGLVCTEAQQRARAKKFKSDESINESEAVQDEYITAEDISQNPHLANTKLASYVKWKETVVNNLENDSKSSRKRKSPVTEQEDDDEESITQSTDSKPVISSKRQRPAPSWETHDTIVL